MSVMMDDGMKLWKVKRQTAMVEIIQCKTTQTVMTLFSDINGIGRTGCLRCIEQVFLVLRKRSSAATLADFAHECG